MRLRRYVFRAFEPCALNFPFGRMGFVRLMAARRFGLLLAFGIEGIPHYANPEALFKPHEKLDGWPPFGQLSE